MTDSGRRRGEITANRPPVQHCGNHTFREGDLPAALDRASIAHAELTRRRDQEAREECWHIYYGDVRAGVIALRVGEAWRVFLSSRTAADFHEWRWERDWTTLRAIGDDGERAPLRK